MSIGYFEHETHPEVAEGVVGDALPGDVLAEGLHHAGVLLGVHGHHRPRDKFAMSTNREVPRLDPH